MDKPRVMFSNSWDFPSNQKQAKGENYSGRWAGQRAGDPGSTDGPAVNIYRSICGHLSKGHLGSRPLRTEVRDLRGVSRVVCSGTPPPVYSCTLQTLLISLAVVFPTRSKQDKLNR